MPLLRLFDAGEENATLFKVIAKNTRQPVQVLGDLRAQVAACRAGEQGFTEIVRRYGSSTAQAYTDELQSLGERLMRAEIAALTDGDYGFVDWIDGVGEDPEPLRIQVAMRIAADEIFIDFSGTAPQVAASINCPVGLVFAACYCAIKGVAEREIPNCEGYMRPIRIHAPEGTLVNPVLPAACGARGVVGYRVYDAVMGALAQVTPDRVIAAGDGGPTLIAFGGYEDGRPFVMTEVIVGTWGARAGKDGLEGVSNPLANLSNQPVELVEADLPLEVVRYELVADSGGAGRFRGGLAYVREFRVLAERAVLTIRSDRRFHPPYGLFGGTAGGASDNVLTTGQSAERLPGMPMAATIVGRGDVYRHVSAGGGGVGSPFERDAFSVLEDVVDGKVSIDAARALYGVVVSIDPPTVDEESTAALRLSLARPHQESV
jgi:N-methylhydantoinase B